MTPSKIDDGTLRNCPLSLMYKKNTLFFTAGQFLSHVFALRKKKENKKVFTAVREKTFVVTGQIRLIGTEYHTFFL